jgi:hypothetical protein
MGHEEGAKSPSIGSGSKKQEESPEKTKKQVKKRGSKKV